MLRFLHLAVAFALLTFAVGPIMAGEEMTARDYIEFVKPFVGSWKTTRESDGKVTKGTWIARESRTGTCLTAFGTGDLPSAQSIHGYDPVSKKWTVVAFDASGGYSLSKIEFDNITKGSQFGKGTTAIGETKVNKSDGTTTTETAKLTCLECTKDKIVMLRSQRTENGKSVPDVTVTSERQLQGQRGARPDLDLPAIPGDYPTAHDYVEYFKIFVGSWKQTTEANGEASTETSRGRIARTKTCFSGYSQGGDRPAVEGLHGYDPVAKMWTVATFDADGGFSIATVKVAHMTKGRQLAVGPIGKRESKRFSPDGTTTVLTSDLGCAELNENRIVLTAKNSTLNGQSVPDSKMILERQPERKRSSKRTKKSR